MPRRQGTPRVLLVTPNGQLADGVRPTFESKGTQFYASSSCADGLKKLTTIRPELLIVSLDMPDLDGTWLLRRVRDDYMGKHPKILVLAKADNIRTDLARLGGEMALLDPVGPEQLITAVFGSSDAQDRDREGDRLHELVKLSVLGTDIDENLQLIAKRLAMTFRASNCIVVATMGDRQHSHAANGHLNPDSPAWSLCRIALIAGVPLLVPDRQGRLSTYLALPIQAPNAHRVGLLMLSDHRPRQFTARMTDCFRSVGTRLGSELAWRSVHERIAADRLRLQENAMLDPGLGVWTAAALEHSLGAEVAACQRRGEPIAMAVIDVRRLRQINLRFGHVAGDAVLKHTAFVIKEKLRRPDRVGRHGAAGFAIVLPGADLHSGLEAIERVRQSLFRNPFLHEGHRIGFDLGVGVALLDTGDSNGTTTLARAAAAMQVAKRQNKAIVVADETTPIFADESDDDADGDVEPGSTLGGMYQIIHEISRGAYGVVYRAEDLGLGRSVALKTLRHDLARDPTFVDRFRGEASILAAIRHEHLVQVYAFGIDGARVYFVMELVEGESLEDRIEEVGLGDSFVPIPEVITICREIASTLDTLHQAGIYHRDVKPANILLDRVRKRAVLVDVGIARRPGSKKEPAGTPGYTAPESLTGEGENATTDVYGLAATVYDLLVSWPPFEEAAEDSVDQVIARQYAGPPKPIHLVRPELPFAVNEVLCRALDPNPSNRYRSAAGFSSAFAEALADFS